MPLIILVIFGTIEIVLLVNITESIGFLTMLWWFFFSAFLGLFIIKYTGYRFLQDMAEQNSQSSLQVSKAILQKFSRFLAGILLIIPGFLSDGLAILMVLPPFSLLLKFFLIRLLKSATVVAGAPHSRASFIFKTRTFHQNHSHQVDNIVDAEFSEVKKD